ncbi:MAG: serine hydrolase domain-containing protein [Chromatiales bacterium]|jgi:N-acyl-D-amino-acid deacylase
MRKGLLCVALIVLATGCGGGGGGSAPPATQSGGVERIDAAMQDVMRRYSPPGIAVAVVRQAKLVFADAYGSADLGGREPLQPDHLFRVASVSKPISGIAALRAAEEGLLEIEAKAFEILAGYLPPSCADARIGDITVWHLMHHTGGWRLWGYPDDPLFRSTEIAGDLGVAMPLSPQDLVRWLAKQPLSFAPGTDFNYTNIGFIALGRVIEQSTGFGYEDFVQRFVLEPAGITTARLGGITREERFPEEVEYESFRDRIWKSVFDGVIVAVVGTTARDGNFYSDLTGGLIDAVNGITDWPETDLFPEYK